MSSPRRAPALALAVATLVVLLVGPGRLAVRAGAQAAGGSAAPLVARVPPDVAAPPPVQLEGFWVEGGTTDRPLLVVRFAQPFPVPSTPWRVSVSAGDPSGPRIRSSLVSVGTAGVSGRAERGDGTVWEDLGEVAVSAPGDGTARLELPLDGVPEGALVWAEAESTDGGRIIDAATSWFALADVLGTRPGPSLGTAPVAATDGDPGAAPVALPGAGPTVRAVSRALELTTTEPVPTDVDGQPVTAVVDTVEIARPADGGTDPAALGRTDLVLVDRSTGAVQLLPEGGEPVDGTPGTTPWLATGLSPTAPGAPATVTFDLEALDQALDGPVLDRATTRLGVTRAVTLADGRVLRSPGVLGTIEWFDDTAFGAEAAVPAPATDEAGLPAWVWLAVAALVVVVVVVVVWLLVRRRRSRARRAASPLPEPEPASPLAPSSPGPVVPPEPAAPAPVAPAVPPEPAMEPVAAAPVAPVSRPEPEVPVAAVAEPVAAAAPPDPADPAVAATPLPVAPVERRRRSGSRPATAVDPLAAFLAEVDELSARVDRLAERQASASGGPPPDPGAAEPPT